MKIIAPSLRPILGGVLAQKPGWRWTFGFLAISGAACLVMISMILPDPARNIVGNGSRPATGLNRSIWTIWQEKRNRTSCQPQGGASDDSSKLVKPKIPNFTRSISILLFKDTAPIVLMNALFYTAKQLFISISVFSVY